MTESRPALWKRSNLLVISLEAVCVIAASLVALTHYLGGDPRPPNALLGAIGFGAPITTATVLLLLGRRFDDYAIVFGLLLSVGLLAALSVVGILVLIPITLTIFTGVELAVLGSVQSLVVPMWLSALLVGSFSYVLWHRDARTWTFNGGIASSDNVVTPQEAVLSISICILTMASGLIHIYRGRCRRSQKDTAA